MNTRKVILIVLGLLVGYGVVKFCIDFFQTRSQLALVAQTEPGRQEEGVRALMGRGVLFDALQGSAAPPVRLNAIASLTRLAEGGKDEAAFAQLLQLLKDPDTESAEQKTHPVRDAAKAAVAKVGVQYPKPLLDAAKDPDGNIRDQSRAALKEIGRPLKTQMAERLSDGDLRGPLGDILAGIGPETIALIAPYLKSDAVQKDSGAKITLIETMGKFTVAEAAPPILPFKDDPDPNVRRSVVTSLANIAQPICAPVLIEALAEKDTDASARAAAAGALGAIATPAANAAMLRALSDSDLFVANAAAAGLKRAGDRAAGPIATALSSADPGVRSRAALAAGGLTSPALAAKALADPEPLVRAVAAASLGDVLIRTKNPAAATPLLIALSDTGGSVATEASRALSRLGAASVPLLSSRLGDPNDTVAYYASQALATVGRDAVDGLIPLAVPGKPTARWAAVTLGLIGSEKAAPALQALTTSPDPDTAYAAQTALARVKPG